MSEEQKQIEGRKEPLVRLWDRDFNCVYSCEGDLSGFFDGLTVTVDEVDGSPRKAGRINSVDVYWGPTVRKWIGKR